jgi:hypothetical protein
MDHTEFLQLPDCRLIVSVPSPSTYYGASLAAGRYCRIPESIAVVPGTWQHGVAPAHLQAHPILVLGAHDTATRDRDYFWVARKDEEAYLRDAGYRRVRAIGLPIAYLPPRPVRRVPGSLLVMPAHSLDFTTHAWDCERYADEIAAVRQDFAQVVVCVHRSCLKKGYWVDAFRARGFPIVTGAWSMDGNSLERMRVLLSTFEYVTTNQFGSHFAYAAYFGARPSLYGTYAEVRVEDYAKESFWEPYPGLLGQLVQAFAGATIRFHYPDFFCHPREAPLRQEWGNEQVGLDNKLSPEEMRQLFGWKSRKLVRLAGREVTRSHEALAEQKGWCEQLEKANAGLSEQVKATQAWCAELQQGKAWLDDQLKRHQDEIAHQVQQVKHQVEAGERQRQEFDTHREEAAQRERQLVAQLGAAREQLQGLARQLQERDDALQAILTSRSWRLLEPVRSLRRLASRRRAG